MDTKILTVNSTAELIRDIGSRKIKSKKEAKGRFNAIWDNDSSKIAGLKIYTKNQNKILNIFMLLKDIFTGLKADKKPDDEQPDTTDMFNLFSEKSNEQRRKEKNYKKHWETRRKNRYRIIF